MFDRNRSYCLLPLVVSFATWVCLIGRASSDEIKMIDGTICEGEILKVAGETLSLRKKDGSVNDIPLKDVKLISGEKEIIIINREEKKFSVLRMPKPENFAISDVVCTTTDTLTSLDVEMKTTKVAAKEASVLKAVPANEPPANKEEVPPARVSASEAKTVTAPPKTWKGNIDAGLDMKDGNTEATATYLKGSYANERTRDNIYFDAFTLYEAVTNNDTDVDEETVNEQRATGKYEYKHTPRFYSFYNQYFEHDEIESLNYRSISSPGAGYRFIDKERLKYKAEAGPAYTYERYHGGIIVDYMGLRVGQYLDWFLLRDTKFHAKLEFMESVENTNDWRVYTTLGLRHNLTKSVALNLDLLDQYDNTPAEGKEKEDRAFIGSVGYNF